MIEPVTIRSAFQEGQDIFTKARPVDADGAVIYSGVVNRVELRVFDMSSADPTSPVFYQDSEEAGTTVAITTVFKTSLYLTGWGVDETGWSFKHQMPSALLDPDGEGRPEYGTIGGHRYKLEYKCAHNTDGLFYIVHLAHCKSLSSV